MNHVTFSYLTCRFDCRIEWFFDALHKQLNGDYTDVTFVVVDYHANREGRRESIFSKFKGPKESLIHTSPKPTVWQGPGRLCKEEYFCAANARNTSLCYAKDGYIVYVDDISLPMPGWIDAVRAAIREGYVALGSYKKVFEMEVENGMLKSCIPHPGGVDSRWSWGSSDNPVPCNGDVLYGCSVAIPVEAMLNINGWDERADALGQGGEDYITGMLLSRNGYHLKYVRSMCTYESEELHHVEKPLKRVIQKIDGRLDSSWEMLNMARDPGCFRAPNYFPEGGIRALRLRILAGEQFPPATIPEHDWYSGKHLSEL